MMKYEVNVKFEIGNLLYKNEWRKKTHNLAASIESREVPLFFHQTIRPKSLIVKNKMLCSKGINRRDVCAYLQKGASWENENHTWGYECWCVCVCV